jgi:hypothetical protein
MFFNAGSVYNAATGSDGGNYGSITLSGNGSYPLSAATTGTYSGILAGSILDSDVLGLSGQGKILGTAC